MLKKITLITLCLAISIIFISCAKTAEVSDAKNNSEMQKAIATTLTNALKIETLPSTGELPAALNASSASSDTKDMVVGVWRAEHPGQGVPYMCVSEWVYQSDGGFSGMTQCGPYAMQRTGKWSLPDNNTMRVSYNDGQMIRWDSWKFRMMDRDRMALGDGAIIAYRVQ